jgi:flagella basal body P-ring formation protein FlgA
MRGILMLLLLGLPAAAQDMVSIRPLAVVDDTVLRLGDIFDGAGARAAQPIGATPAPGRRYVLEPAQLMALARQHALAWRPLSANERVVVERPGRALAREEVEAALRAELRPLGLDPDAELELGPLLPPFVPPGALVQLTAEGIGFDAGSGRFSATLVVAATGAATQRLRLAGRAAATVPVVVATRRLGIGAVIGPGDARPARLRAERVRAGTAERLDQVLGQQLRRPVGAELPFLTADLMPRALVEKNAPVTLVLEGPGLTLSAQGRALEAAPRGGMVPVMNLASHAVLEGQVIGPGRVRIAAGSLPLSR